MKEVFYKKVGRRYIPVSEYDSLIMDALPYGFVMIHVREGMRSYKYNVDPAEAPVVAACALLRDKIEAAMQKAAELEIRPDLKNNKKWMQAYKEFEEKVNKIQGHEIIGRYNSRADLIDAAMKVIEDEATK